MNYFEMKWRLSACRIQAGYSQAEVAEILGCSDKTIVSWETGKTAPKMEKAQELSDLYGIPLISMRRVRNFTQKERSALIQVFTLASIR